MRVYYDSAIGEQPPVVINGNPPVDQSAEVAALQAEVARLEGEVAGRQTAIDAMKAAANADMAADAANVAGQGVLDAAGPY
jgi:hypothetical protein